MQIRYTAMCCRYATQRGSGEPGVDTIQSKVDFKRPDTKRYPLFEKAQVFNVNVLPGNQSNVAGHYIKRSAEVNK